MHRIAIALWVLGLPATLLANLSETIVLPQNTPLNFDTGQIGSSGGDIVWDGHTIAPQGAAVLHNDGPHGLASFGVLGQSLVESELRAGNATPIPENLVVPGDLFLVRSNGGHPAKAVILAKTGTALTLQLTTFAVTPPAGLPLISQIVNNSSFLPFGYPHYGIAPSSLFVVTGSSLADPGDPVLHSSEAPGIPLTLNGASLTVVVNGVTVHPALYYTSPTQLAAVLPAATPVGFGTITVTYNGQASQPAPMQVVPTALGINYYYGNVGVATDNTTGALLTYTNTGVLGETIVLWTTGLGADPADSDTTLTSTPHAINTPLQIYIGGVQATILYAGASPYPGVDQINLTIPAGVPTGCWVPLVAVTNGNAVGNVVTLPISAGGGECVDAIDGYKGSQISGGITLRTGLVVLLHVDSPKRDGTHDIQNSTDAAFVKYTGLFTPTYQLSPGGCIAGPVVASPIPKVTGLDMGSLRLTGPAGLDIALPTQFGIKGTFYSPLGADVYNTGGTFTFHGSGGADVGSFSVDLDVSSPLLAWTNQSAAAQIDRSKGLPVTWTGGNPGSYVIISGASTTQVGTPVKYDCMVSADAGQFTVPSSILLALPDGNGSTLVQNQTMVPFSADGLDIAVADATASYSVNSTYSTGVPSK
jgi:uncharacterized protein (TIGR03437 family)